MRSVLQSEDAPPYLDAQAAEYLFSARETFQQLGLEDANFLPAGRHTHVLTWTGSEMNSVLAFALSAAGLDCEAMDIGVTVLDTAPETVASLLAQIADAPPPIEDIAEFVESLRTEKFDELIPEPILRRLWATARRNEAGTLQALASKLAKAVQQASQR